MTLQNRDRIVPCQALKCLNEGKFKYSLYFKDLGSGRTCGVDENVRIPSASLIKLFIMAETFRQVDRGTLSLDREPAIREEDRAEETLEKGRTYSLKELITLMIIRSDNVAANILIDMVEMENINCFIRDTHLSNTFITRKMLDFDARKAGRENYTSACDIALFLELLYNGRIINSAFSSMMLDIMSKQLDKSMMRLCLPGDVKAAHKTGNLQGINHDAGIIFTSKGNYILAVLTWDCDDDKRSRRLIGKASKVVYDCFTEE